MFHIECMHLIWFKRKINGSGNSLSIDSPAEDIIIKDNIIRDTGKGTQKAAVLIDKNSLPIDCLSINRSANLAKYHPMNDRAP